MLSEKPVNYKENTWRAVTSKLSSMPDDAVLELSGRLGSRASNRGEAVKRLLAQGGLILVELDLINDPTIMAGTVFMADEIHQYIIYPKAARELAGGLARIQVNYIGGKPARDFSRRELLDALSSTPEFDQLEL